MWVQYGNFSNNWTCWLADFWKGIPGPSSVFWSSILLCLLMFDIISPLMSCAALRTWAFAHSSMSGPKTRRVQIPLTPGRLVRKFPNVQWSELWAEPLPRGAPVLSIPISSGLQRLGASVPSDLYHWPDTSLSHGGARLTCLIHLHFSNLSQNMCETHQNWQVHSQIALVTEKVSVWSALRSLIPTLWINTDYNNTGTHSDACEHCPCLIITTTTEANSIFILLVEGTEWIQSTSRMSLVAELGFELRQFWLPSPFP